MQGGPCIHSGRPELVCVELRAALPLFKAIRQRRTDRENTRVEMRRKRIGSSHAKSEAWMGFIMAFKAYGTAHAEGVRHDANALNLVTINALHPFHTGDR